MNSGFKKEQRNLFTIAAFSLLLGWSFGYPFELLSLALFLYLLWLISKTRSFFDWLKKGTKKPYYDQDGLWGDVVHHLENRSRRQNKAKTRYKSALLRVNKLTEALDQGVIVLKQDFCLDWWNDAAADLIGLEKKDKGNPVTNLMRLPAFVAYIHQKSHPKSLEIVSPLSEQVHLSISATRVDHRELVMVVTDTTQIKNLEQTRKDFVANVSHELRTPLTVLKGYSETLPDVFPDNPVLVKAMSQMNSQIHRMQQLADDLLMLAKMESGNQHLETREIQVLPLLLEIKHQAEKLSQNQHSFNIQCDETLYLRGNRSEIYSALSNLVFNAVKHNPQGCQIRLKTSLRKKWLRIQVEDNGVGFDPIHIPRITERFYRLDQSRNSDTGGTGLGLAIVKHVILRHKGLLMIQSKEHKGATFICKFPISMDN